LEILMAESREAPDIAGLVAVARLAKTQTNHQESPKFKNLVPQFALLSPTCSFSAPASHSPHATFESGKEVCARRKLPNPLPGQEALLFRWC
jgi:hypothetical protein